MFTVHPTGIPSGLPTVHPVIFAFFVNTPLPDTLSTQFVVQPVADMSVARQVIDDSEEHPENIPV